jgi:hypothetical protein
MMIDDYRHSTSCQKSNLCPIELAMRELKMRSRIRYCEDFSNESGDLPSCMLHKSGCS